MCAWWGDNWCRIGVDDHVGAWKSLGKGGGKECLYGPVAHGLPDVAYMACGLLEVGDPSYT